MDFRFAVVKKQTEIYGLVYESRKTKNFFSVWFDELANQKLFSGLAEKYFWFAKFLSQTEKKNFLFAIYLFAYIFLQTKPVGWFFADPWL